MPAPATTDQLLETLRKSGLIPPPQLDALLDAAPFDETPPQLLDRLVESGHLTRYQADKIAAGKYRGFVLGPYMIRDRLGGGGMGHVFLAEHAAMRRNVAIKVLSVGTASDPVARERFLREARVAAGLDHPNIVRVYDFRQEESISYLVLEYIRGESLQHVVARNGPIPWRYVADFGRQIALGLQYAHEHGLVHRDIKPGNLLISPDGIVKIIDLGLVRGDEVEGRLTAEVDKTILGTADYLAPEQAVNSATVDIRADIYSLGATLYFLLAGRVLFPDGKIAQKLMFQQLKEPEPIRDVAPNVPEELAGILHRCLAKSPDERFASPIDLADALAAQCDQTPPLPPPEWFPEPTAGCMPPSGLLPVKRPGLESTVLPPLPGTQGARSSSLFSAPAPASKASQAQQATMTDLNNDTPRRTLTRASALTSHVYVPERELNRDHPAPPASHGIKHSPILWALLGMVITLVTCGILILARPF